MQLYDCAQLRQKKNLQCCADLKMTEWFLPVPQREYYTPRAHGACRVGWFCRPTHEFDSEVHVFASCKRCHHCTYCTVSTVSPRSLSWLPAGIIVTYIRSNGDGVPATVISASECGQCVSIE